LAYKILVGLLAVFDFISSWLAFKSFFALLAGFWPFYAEIASFEEKYYYSIFRQHICKIFVINAISDPGILVLVILEEC